MRRALVCPTWVRGISNITSSDFLLDGRRDAHSRQRSWRKELENASNPRLKKFLDGYISITAYDGMSPFEAVAEPNRRQILDLLRAGERPAGELVEAMGLSQPGVSKHLKMLREAGLVSVRPDGQRRLYRLEPRELETVDAWLEPYRLFWAARLDALEEHLEKEQ